ncbi:single-stranded DNA-binding protein [Deinococcus sonorensis]|uniref:Single-stranded DNA-binding protein n=2 Tax=Deinococcus sonorensis TaxID=309891 RepID=A0AAU7U6I2_9DEIO
MARGMNHIFLIVPLARDPDLRSSPSGMAIFEVTVAGKDHLIGLGGQVRRLLWAHPVHLLGQAAERLAERHLKVGDPVMVEGALESRSWDAPDGGKRHAVQIKGLQLEALWSAPTPIHDAKGGVRRQGGMNQVLVIGNLTRDAALRYTLAGDAVLSVALAVNEVWKDTGGDPQERVHDVDVTAWRALAEVAKDLKRGDPVLVQGRLTTARWIDKDGHTRTTARIEASRMELLTPGPRHGQALAHPVRATGPATRAAGRAGDAEDVPPGDDLPF